MIDKLPGQLELLFMDERVDNLRSALNEIVKAHEKISDPLLSRSVVLAIARAALAVDNIHK